jgi:mannitol-1-/sugar-/sorbitol-6-phosphatase
LRRLACDAVLFDLDGVLVDSTAVVVKTWRVWAEKRGFDAERILQFAHGRKATETIRAISSDLDPDVEVEALERLETKNLEGVLEVEGARELLGSLPSDGWTVVTSGTRALAEGRMTHLALPMPERFVTADDVSEGKPHPEANLKGAEILKARPEACVVVEDAPSGIRAARAAGMRVVALATTYPVEGLHEADVVAPALANMSVTRDTGSHGGPRFELSVSSFRGGREEATARD